MSTKTTRKTTSQSTSQASSSATPQQSSTRPQSPGLSPTRFSRLQEKADLQNLNDRLACYIDRVRQLETENSGLRREVQTSQETITREVTTLKHMYEKELSDARRLLDDTARERARLEIDTKRMYDENADMKSRLDKKTKDYANAEKHLSVLEPKVADLTAKYNQAVAERKKAQDEAKELDKECTKLRAQVNELRKFLEEETLIRIDLENNLQSLKEDLSFKEQVFNKELTETRTRRQVEISEIDGRLSEVYEAKLQQTLQDLRDQYEAQMRANREEIETLYDAKIRNAQNLAQRNSGAASHALEEIRQSRLLIDQSNSRITELESANSSLQARLRDMETMMANERESSLQSRQVLERELQHLQDEMEKQLQEYQDLMDIKVALDLEIAAYRKLLESEEARLNISPMQSPAARTGGTRSTPLRRTPVNVPGRKRKRLEESSEKSMSQFQVTSHASGDVEIAEVCPDGRFVRLRNKGDKEVSLSGWQILRVAGDNESTFKFHRSAKLEAGGTVTIWSSDAGQTAEPPSNLVMKGQKWFVSDSMTTFVKDSSGEEMASSERKREQHSVSRHREMSGFLSSQRGGLGEDLYHQQGDPQGDDRCAIM